MASYTTEGKLIRPPRKAARPIAGPLASLSRPDPGSPAAKPPEDFFRLPKPPRDFEGRARRKGQKREITLAQKIARLENLNKAHRAKDALRKAGLLPPPQRRKHAVRQAMRALEAREPPPPPPGPITITLTPDIARFGPAMCALPHDQQRAFVLAVLHHGGKDLLPAYRAAGYEVADPVTARQHAKKLSADHRFQAALREEVENQLKTGLLAAATRRLGEVLEGERVKPADVLKAVGMIYDRAGLHEVKERQVTVTLGDDRARIERIRLMVEQLGLGEAVFHKLVGSRLAAASEPTTTDAVYTELDQDDPAELDEDPAEIEGESDAA